MSASLSGEFNLQEFTDLGALAAGYRLYTYIPGTTTSKTAFTEASGTVAHTYTSDGLGGQYIALNARGELPAPLFLTSGGYDLTLKTAAGATVWTRRAIGQNDAANDADASLRADLANTSTGTKGAGLPAFHGSDVAYAAGSVGARLKLTLHVEDPQFGAVGNGVTNDHDAIQAAVDYAETLVGSNAFDGPSVEIRFSHAKYLCSTAVTVQGHSISFVGPVGRGAMITGPGILFDVGDPTDATRLRFITFENIHFYSSTPNGSAAAVKVYRTIETRFRKCLWSNFNIGIDCYRASTMRVVDWRVNNTGRTAQAEAFIKLQGTDESAFASPNTYTPGGGHHITDGEFEGAASAGSYDTTYGLEVMSVDGLYVTQCHWTGCVNTIATVPDATAANRTIIDIHVHNNYMDEPSAIAATPRNVLIGGTVKESITLASGGTGTSIYEKIHFVGGTIRGSGEADRCVMVQVTDGDSWWDSARKLRAITFDGVTIGQATASAVQFFGAGNAPTDTYVEATGVKFDGCTFYQNASSNPTGVGSAIQAQVESIALGPNTFLSDTGTSDYVISIVPTDFGDDNGAGSVLMAPQDFSQASGYTVGLVNISPSAVGANVSQGGSIVPGPGRIDNGTPFKVTTTNATPTTVWSYLIPTFTAGRVAIEITGCDSTGARFVIYSWTAAFKRDSGTAALSGGAAVAGDTYKDATTPAPTFTLSTNTLTLTATGVAATTINWTAKVVMTLAR